MIYLKKGELYMGEFERIINKDISSLKKVRISII